MLEKENLIGNHGGLKGRIMVKLIEPKYHEDHKPLIEPLLELIRDNQDLSASFQNYKKATFVVERDENRGIYGGALLLKKKFSALYEKIGENAHAFASENDVIWNCTICVQMKPNDSRHYYESLCKILYRNLYEKLLEFGIKERTDFIWLSLTPVEYLSTELIGFWPYEVRLRPKQSPDGLFHGILPLAKSQAAVFSTIWASSQIPSRELGIPAY